MHSFLKRGLMLLAIAGMTVGIPAYAIELPPGFSEEEVGSLWTEPVGLVFDPSPQGANRIYVWERAGRVWVLENGVNSWTPLLDIRDEVGAWRDYGMLGFALDPNFQQNGYIYVSYVVDRHHLLHAGKPTYDPAANDYLAATIGRVTRYTARVKDGLRTVDPASRKVLVGETISSGIPILHGSHGPGNLLFGADGTLLVAVGDAASWEGIDDGGSDGNSYAPQGLIDGIIQPKEDVGSFRSQLVDSLSGKILRLDPQSGDGVPSNPFFDPANPRAAKSRVWALGLRNPYRMALRPGTGSHFPSDANPGVLVLGDVGWEDWEEVHVIDGPGQNCGWPLYQGLTEDPTYQASEAENRDAPNPLGGFFRFEDLLVQETLGAPSWPNPRDPAQQIPPSAPRFMHKRPVLDIGRSHELAGPARTGVFSGNTATEIKIGAAGSPVAGPQFLANTSTGGVFYHGADFPERYRGSYFHADFGQRWIKNIVFDSNHRPVEVRHFATDVRPVFLATHPTDGALYYVDMTIPAVRKIVYAPGENRPPIAAAAVNQVNGASPLTVQFNSSGSRDPDGEPLTYRWQFGDGAESSAPNPSHTFTSAEPRRFDVRLTVTDAAGATAHATLSIFVNHTLPEVEVLSPIAGTKYPLTAATEYQLIRRVIEAPGHPTTTRWNVFLVHNEHEHGEPAITTPEAVVTLSPVHSHSESYSYRIVLTVTDDLGAIVQREVRLFPNAGNAAPKLSWLRATYAPGLGAATLLDPAATVSDADSAGIESGALLIESSGEAELSVLPSGDGPLQVTTIGSDVFVGGVKVGALSSSGSTLEVGFNGAATPAAAQAILRRVAARFTTSGRRTVVARISDGDGGMSAAASLTVKVADVSSVVAQVLAITGGQVPGEPEGTVFAAFSGPFGGPFAGRIRSGSKQSQAIFAADGSVRIKAGDPAPGLDGARLQKLKPPSGDAALGALTIGSGGVSAADDTVLLAGLVDGPPRIAAREGAELTDQPGLAIKRFLSIDGMGSPGAPIFFTGLLRGNGVTPANNLALCAAFADGSVRLLARKGQAVGEQKISIIGTLVAVKGTLAANRWRAGDEAIGVRLTFTDKTQALYTIPAAASAPDQWIRWAASGDSVVAGAKELLIRSFGLPGFGAADFASVANLHAGSGGVGALNDRAIISNVADGLGVLVQKGSAAPQTALSFATFGHPIIGDDQQVAFSASVATKGGALTSGLWYSTDGENIRELARSGQAAPGGGHFAKFSSMAWPGGQGSGLAFTAKLQIDPFAGISGRNNTGLWAVDSTGTLQLLLRKGQRVVIDGVERTITSFVTLTPGSGYSGAAQPSDRSGKIVVTARLSGGATALLVLSTQ